MPANIKDLLKFLHKNLLLHTVIENEVRLVPFGQITFNVLIKDGVAQIETLNINRNRRKKYKLDKKA